MADAASLTFLDHRLVPLGRSASHRLNGLARRVLDWPQRLGRQLFPSTLSDGPIQLLAGHGADIRVRLVVPGARYVHLYAETHLVAGAMALAPPGPQVLELDADGRGEAVLRVVPRDATATGQSDLRIVAVRPDAPDEVAAEIAALPIAQHGTAALTYGILAALLVLGMVLQVEFGWFPILAIMILLAFAYMGLNRPDYGPVRYAGWRLLPMRQRLRTAGLLILGASIWAAMMLLNYWDLPTVRFNTIFCGEIVDLNACSQGEVLFDNATSIAASFGFAICVFLAVAPAIRPRAMAGRMMLVSALWALLLFDLTLLGPILTRVAGAETPMSVAWYTLLYFPLIGWAIAGLGLFFTSRGHGFGKGGFRALTLATGLAVLLLPFVMSWISRSPLFFTFVVDSWFGEIWDGRYDVYFLFIFSIAAVLVAATAYFLIVRLPGWRVIRFLCVLALPLIVLALLPDPYSAFLPEWERPKLLPFQMLVYVCGVVVAGFADVSLWMALRERRKRLRRQAAAPDTDPAAATDAGVTT